MTNHLSKKEAALENSTQETPDWEKIYPRITIINQALSTRDFFRQILAAGIELNTGKTIEQLKAEGKLRKKDLKFPWRMAKQMEDPFEGIRGPYNSKN